MRSINENELSLTIREVKLWVKGFKELFYYEIWGTSPHNSCIIA
jgi:hypothetical protein